MSRGNANLPSIYPCFDDVKLNLFFEKSKNLDKKNPNFSVYNFSLFLRITAMLLFSSNIKYLRKQKKVTQLDIANAVGVSDNAISNYENGKFFPTADILVKLCEYLNVSPDDLLLKDLASGVEAEVFESAQFEKGNNVLVPLSAQEEYVGKWSKKFIRELTYVNVPGVEGEARTFEVSGNGMNPILLQGDFAACTASSLAEVQSGKIYAIVTSQKIHWGYIQVQHERLQCIPANTDEHEAYFIPETDVREVWEVQRRITGHLVEPALSMEGRLRTVEEWLKSKFSDEMLR